MLNKILSLRIIHYPIFIICCNFSIWAALKVGSNSEGFEVNPAIWHQYLLFNLFKPLSNFLLKFYTDFHGIPVSIWVAFLVIAILIFSERRNGKTIFSFEKYESFLLLLLPIGVFATLVITGSIFYFIQCIIGFAIFFLIVQPYYMGFIGGDYEDKLFFCYLNSALFLAALRFAFIRVPRKNEIKLFASIDHFTAAAWELYPLPLLHTLRYVFLLYSIYLTPSVLFWIYPVIQGWFGITNKSMPYSYNILGYIFITALALIFFRLVKKHREVLIIDLKEELKDELKKEIKE
jgi:hypothetical protein